MKNLFQVRQLIWLAAFSFPVLFFVSSVRAETLLDTITPVKRSPFEQHVNTLERISSEEIQTISQDAEVNGTQPRVTEYQLGNQTVREYRTGGDLQYVEVLNEGIPNYIIDYTASGADEDGLLSNSGIRITGW